MTIIGDNTSVPAEYYHVYESRIEGNRHMDIQLNSKYFREGQIILIEARSEQDDSVVAAVQLAVMKQKSSWQLW